MPVFALSDVITLLAQHMVAMLRIGAFLVASPVFGGRFVPLPIRIVATAVLALPVMATVPLPLPEVIASLSFVAVAFSELLIGLVAGLTLTVLFGAASIAGDRIASTAGLGFAAQFDASSGGQTPIIASIFSLFLLSVFLGTDGHLIAIRLILESYTSLPIGGTLNLPVLVAAGVASGATLFSAGASIMLPVVSILLLLNILIGMLTRSAPQLNVFSFGFPVTMSATMLLIFLYAPELIAAFEALVETGLSVLNDMLEAAYGG